MGRVVKCLLGDQKNVKVETNEIKEANEDYIEGKYTSSLVKL